MNLRESDTEPILYFHALVRTLISKLWKRGQGIFLLGGKTMTTKTEVKHKPYYDYENQVWVINGVFAKCGHEYFVQACFACQHHGESAIIMAQS